MSNFFMASENEKFEKMLDQENYKLDDNSYDPDEYDSEDHDHKNLVPNITSIKNDETKNNQEGKKGVSDTGSEIKIGKNEDRKSLLKEIFKLEPSFLNNNFEKIFGSERKDFKISSCDETDCSDETDFFNDIIKNRYIGRWKYGMSTALGGVVYMIEDQGNKLYVKKSSYSQLLSDNSSIDKFPMKSKTLKHLLKKGDDNKNVYKYKFRYFITYRPNSGIYSGRSKSGGKSFCLSAKFRKRKTKLIIADLKKKSRRFRYNTSIRKNMLKRKSKKRRKL